MDDFMAKEHNVETDICQRKNDELISRLAELKKSLCASTNAKRLHGVDRLTQHKQDDANVISGNVLQGGGPYHGDDILTAQTIQKGKPLDLAHIARDVLARQVCKREEGLSAADALGALEKDRRDKIWNAYSAERKLRTLRRCWRATERLHAKNIARLSVVEERLAVRDAKTAEDQATLRRAQGLEDDDDLDEQQRLAMESAVVRARLERAEAELESERQVRRQDRKQHVIASKVAEQELDALRKHIASLELQLSECTDA